MHLELDSEPAAPEATAPDGVRRRLGPAVAGAAGDVRQLRNFVEGAFIDGGRPFDVVDPATGRRHAVALEADSAIVDAAVEAAQRCGTTQWGTMPLSSRRALLLAVADRIEHQFDEFVAAEVADTGKPRATAERVDIPRAAANFRAFADCVATLPDEVFETETPDGGRAINYSVRKPLGVVAVIAPWNLPLLLTTWKVAPAMACGNAVVVKPSEETPSTTTLLAEVMAEVGVPDGAFNVVHGFGPESAGELLAAHPGVRAVTFTGETRTGAAIMRSAAATTKALSFELGGKNAALVFADADVEAAAVELARAAFLNTGQVCLAPERIYVEREIFDRFVNAMKREAGALRPGLPTDPTTTLGPLISEEHRQKVLSYYHLAIEEGATVVTGGGIPSLDGDGSNGYFVEPTIWTGLPQHARVMREEIFGPCCHLAPFDDEQQAIRLANDTDYGLAASIWTRDLSRAHRVGRAMDVGTSWINCWFVRDLRAPFGGAKRSGFGREGGAHSIAFYSELTNVCVRV